VFADITETSRTEESISHGVGDGVGVAMPFQAGRVRNRHQTELEWSSGVIAEAMNVESLANTHDQSTLILR
jgi:hypothetical protein